MMKETHPIDVIAFDADDTLWHNETLFFDTKAEFVSIVSQYNHDPGEVARKLDETELGNLQYFGYGIKSFTISMLETAFEIAGDEIKSQDLRKIVSFAKKMMTDPLRLFEYVSEVVRELSASYKLMVITKGDLFDQERKIAQSGLSHYFTYIDVVSEKTPEAYKAVFEKYRIDPQTVLMVGNSLRSDILPVIAIGGQAVHIPYHLAWEHENMIDHYEEQGGYHECDHIGLLPQLIEQLKQSKTSVFRGKSI